MLSLVLVAWWSQGKSPPERACRWPDPDLQLKARLLLFEQRLVEAGKLIARTREHRWVTNDVSGGCSFKLLLMDVEQTPRVAARPALPLDPKAHALGGACVHARVKS